MESEGIEPIVMRGFFISISLPSEGLFQRRFRDEEIIIDEIRKEFDLIAQKFITRFKTLRHEVYANILPRHTIKIQHTQARAVYFLPQSQAKGFLDNIDEIRKEYSDLQYEIDKYLKERNDSWLNKVEEYTTVKNIKSWDYCPNLPSRVVIDLTPLELSPTMLRDFIQSEAEEQELWELNYILREKYRETVQQSVKELEQKLADLIQRISRTITTSSIRKNNLALARATLEELDELTKSANLEGILGANFKQANLYVEVLDEFTEGQLRKKGNLEKLKAATTELVRNLGYDEPLGDFDPRTVLEDLSIDMRRDLSPRVKALMEEVL